jgi:predicted aspartyl protease
MFFGRLGLRLGLFGRGSTLFLVGGAALGAVSAVLADAVVSPPVAASQMRHLELVADEDACGTRLLGAVAIATPGGIPVVSASANGHELSLLLDTGAEQTILAPGAAGRIGAQPPRIEFARPMRGIAGVMATREVELRSFSVGAVAIPWHRVLVAPIAIAAVSSPPLDGVLGADVLIDFDIDLDLAHQRLAFYRKQSCPTATPAWTGPYTEIGVGRSRNEHLFFPVELDDRRIYAFLDTGSQRTVLSTATAKAFALTEAVLARDPPITMRGATGERLEARLHRFSQLRVGNQLVRDPQIVVTTTKVSDADMVLGTDFLAARRLWLSYGSGRLFLSSR